MMADEYYGYSPAAYERYIVQQARVSNWVDDTLQQAHAWSNPFVLSPIPRDRSFCDGPSNDYPRRHDQRATHPSNERTANVEQTIQELRNQLAESQQKTHQERDNLTQSLLTQEESWSRSPATPRLLS